MTTNDESVVRAMSADARAHYEKLRARQAQLKSAISTNTGEARAKMQADLDRIESEIMARLALEEN